MAFPKRICIYYHVGMAGPEKLFENKIKNELKKRGIWYVKYFANRMTIAGIPDLLCCVNGHFVALEIKADKGRPSELQKYQIRQIQASGGIAMIVYPDDWDNLLKLLDDLAK